MARFFLDRSSSIPLYRQLETQLEAAIEGGEWGTGDRLPSETVLSHALGISVMTVRQAMNELVQKKRIVRYKGLGTFIRNQELEFNLTRLTGFTEEMQIHGRTPTSRLLAFELVPPPFIVAQALKLPPKSQVLHIRRLRLIDGEPHVLQSAYLAFLGLTQDELEAMGSLYSVLEAKGVHLVMADEMLKAVAADRDQAQLLEVAPGTALLRITRITYDPVPRSIEYSISYGRGDLYSYAIRLRRDSSS